MPTDRENFEAWFARPLETLYDREECGFIIVMVTLPLLERYLQQKVKLIPKRRRREAFFAAFEQLFPLGGKAETFWWMCRSGLLHQGTFNGRGVFIVHGQNEPLVLAAEASGQGFRLEPVVFAQKVLASIRSSFEDYADIEPPLPTVSWLLAETRSPEGIPHYTTILGTGAPPAKPDTPSVWSPLVHTLK